MRRRPTNGITFVTHANELALTGSGPAGKASGVDILTELAVIMGVAALTTVIFPKIKNPVVLGYILAGLIVGAHLPVPLFANKNSLREQCAYCTS